MYALEAPETEPPATTELPPVKIVKPPKDLLEGWPVINDDPPPAAKGPTGGGAWNPAPPGGGGWNPAPSGTEDRGERPEQVVAPQGDSEPKKTTNPRRAVRPVPQLKCGEDSPDKKDCIPDLFEIPPPDAGENANDTVDVGEDEEKILEYDSNAKNQATADARKELELQKKWKGIRKTRELLAKEKAAADARKELELQKGWKGIRKTRELLAKKTAAADARKEIDLLKERGGLTRTEHAVETAVKTIADTVNTTRSLLADAIGAAGKIPGELKKMAKEKADKFSSRAQVLTAIDQMIAGGKIAMSGNADEFAEAVDGYMKASIFTLASTVGATKGAALGVEIAVVISPGTGFLGTAAIPFISFGGGVIAGFGAVEAYNKFSSANVKEISRQFYAKYTP